MPVEDVSASDRLWQQAGSELMPARSLARVDEKAQQVVTNVSVLAAVLTGLGLLTSSQLNHAPGARALSVATLIIAWVSVLLAYGSQLLRISPATAPGDIVQVRAWYGRQFRRAYAVVAAGGLSLVSLALGGVTALVVLTAPTTADRPSVDVRFTGAGASLTVDLSFPNMPGGRMTARVTGLGPGTAQTNLAAATVMAGADGTAATTLEVPNVAKYWTIRISATSPTYTCDGIAEPASGAPPTLTCTR